MPSDVPLLWTTDSLETLLGVPLLQRPFTLVLGAFST